MGLTKKITKFKERFGIAKGVGRDADKKYSGRYDLKRFDITPELLIDVFWKDLEVGLGPALSCYVLGHEVLKFDCFGASDGHMHIDGVKFPETKEQRLFYPEPTRELQIERCLFDLSYNFNYYLQRHPNQDIRRYTFDQQALTSQMESIKQAMVECMIASEAHAASN